MKSPEEGMGTPEGPEQKEPKIFVSKDWTQEERERLIELMNKKIEGLDTEETKLRERIKYEAPCFGEIAKKRNEVKDLISKLENTSSEFLEANRRNFEDFISDAE